MSHDRLAAVLGRDLEALREAGTDKGDEAVIVGIVAAAAERGPRYILAGEPDRGYIRMNSNGYLGLAGHPKVRAAEEEAVLKFGAGPGAVRFISGTWEPHIALERRLASFHGRESAMIYSSAYATTMGVVPPLVTKTTGIISDELNHNSIINSIRLAQPAEKRVYPHADMPALRGHLNELSAICDRVIVVTDGIFSMRGDHAPLRKMADMVREYDGDCAENVLLVVDDSHGVGAFGETGRGVEEFERADGVDLVIATLGKAFGVNGGYVTGAKTIIDYLRETSPFYIYSNPITPGEAAAALAAIDIVDSAEGRDLLVHLRKMTARFERGLTDLGLETISGEHPVVPLMVRDTTRTAALISHLRENGVLATGLNFPVVPKGEEEIRFQISSDHTPADIDEVLGIVAGFSE